MHADHALGLRRGKDLQPARQLLALLVAGGVLRVDEGDVLLPREDDRRAPRLQLVAQQERHGQVQVLFRRAVCAGAAAVIPAVAGIHADDPARKRPRHWLRQEDGRPLLPAQQRPESHQPHQEHRQGDQLPFHGKSLPVSARFCLPQLLYAKEIRNMPLHFPERSCIDFQSIRGKFRVIPTVHNVIHRQILENPNFLCLFHRVRRSPRWKTEIRSFALL